LLEASLTSVLSFREFSELVWAKTVQKGYPMAFWKLPNQTEIQAVADTNTHTRLVQPDLEQLERGFIVSPFVQYNKKCFFIPATTYFSYSITEKNTHVAQYIIDDVAEKIGIDIHSNLSATFSYFSSPHHQETVSEANQKTAYISTVNKAIKAIQNTDFQKVVLSRTKEIAVENINPFAIFEQLCTLYPTAFVSLVFLPECGVWVGASPETLISIDEKAIFRTVALAGTQPRSNTANLSDATWRQKEIEEQALVSRYIINCFKKIRLREFEEIGPRTVAAGSLMHLRTDFEVDTIKTNFKQLPTVMLDLLHPTSAVCGMPKPESLAFVLENEGYDRKLYSGFLGQVNINNCSHLFVNLRCAQLFSQSVILYAGAGITQDSDPEKEWNETEIKMQVIAKAI
jgi:isochorismate synthase